MYVLYTHQIDKSIGRQYSVIVVYFSCSMYPDKLTNLKVGDIVAFQPFYSRQWTKTEVVATTDRCIVVKCEPDKKFWKSNGASTSKEYDGDKISLITSSIQENWDRRDNAVLLSCLLVEHRDKLSVETLKEALSVLVLNNQWDAAHYVAILRKVMETCDSSSGSLRKATEVLQHAVKK